jgi:hypothetical protein
MDRRGVSCHYALKDARRGVAAVIAVSPLLSQKNLTDKMQPRKGSYTTEADTEGLRWGG